MRKAKKRAGKPRKKVARKAAAPSRFSGTVVKWRDADSGGHFEMYLPPTWKAKKGDPE